MSVHLVQQLACGNRQDLSCRYHPSVMPLLQEVMPLLMLDAASSWTTAELQVLQSHFGALGSALASLMDFALADAITSGSLTQLPGQSKLEPPGLLDLAGANVLQVIVAFLQICPSDIVQQVTSVLPKTLRSMLPGPGSLTVFVTLNPMQKAS